jgi:hypothetical protein
MPAHGAFLDDHAIASIATFINKRFNKERNLVASAEVLKIRNTSTGNEATMTRTKIAN